MEDEIAAGRGSAKSNNICTESFANIKEALGGLCWGGG